MEETSESIKGLKPMMSIQQNTIMFDKHELNFELSDLGDSGPDLILTGKNARLPLNAVVAASSPNHHRSLVKII